MQGIGIDDILEAIVKRVPAPKDTRKERLRALIFDSYYDAYKVCTAVLHGCDVYMARMRGMPCLPCESSKRLACSAGEVHGSCWAHLGCSASP